MNQAIQKRNEGGSALAVGTFRNAQHVNQLMERAQQEAILVSPATSVGAMPEGVGIALTKVVVDLAKNDKGEIVSNDTYDVGGKRGLSKTVLQKIGAALGVSWDPRASGRIDDGRDPHYCHWRAVGTYRAFDGQVQTLVAEKEMDLREGSAQVVALVERYTNSLAKFKAGRGGKYEPKDPRAGQIREMRLHILAHSESKAQLRAIRSLGIKSAYTEQELQKPFVCARVMWTGQTDDPELRRVFAEKTADAFLGGAQSLYGRRNDSFTPEKSGPAPLKLTGAPPVGSVGLDEEDIVDMGELGGDAPAQSQPANDPQPKGPAPEQSKAATPRRAAAATSGPTLPGGDSKGKPLSEAGQKDLEYWSNRLERDLQDGSSRNPRKDEELMDAVNSELARRAEQGQQQELGGGKY